MKEKEEKWLEFINANKESYFESVGQNEKRVKTFNSWSVQKQYLHLKRFLKIKTPQFRKTEFVKQTLRNLERLKSALIVKDEFGLLNYDEYTSLTNKVDEVLEIISGYKNKLKEIKKTTLQKQLEVLQTEMKSL